MNINGRWERYEVKVVQRVSSVDRSAVKMGEIRHHAPITYDKLRARARNKHRESVTAGGVAERLGSSESPSESASRSTRLGPDN